MRRASLVFRRVLSRTARAKQYLLNNLYNRTFAYECKSTIVSLSVAQFLSVYFESRSPPYVHFKFGDSVITRLSVQSPSPLKQNQGEIFFEGRGWLYTGYLLLDSAVFKWKLPTRNFKFYCVILTRYFFICYMAVMVC